MPNYSKNDIVLVRYPFSDLTSSKVRPAVVVNGSHASHDLFIVALTSKVSSLLKGEFRLSGWKASVLNVETSVKRSIFTIHNKLVLKVVGKLTVTDAASVDASLRIWLDIA
jgi:mRNA interferase MazF